jgi:hypothetical protein
MRNESFRQSLISAAAAHRTHGNVVCDERGKARQRTSHLIAIAALRLLCERQAAQIVDSPR